MAKKKKKKKELLFSLKGDCLLLPFALGGTHRLQEL